MSKLEALQETKTKKYELTRIQQLMVIGVIGIIVMSIFYYMNSDDAVATPTPPNVNTKTAEKTLGKKDNEVTAAVTRDPFGMAPGHESVDTKNNNVLSREQPGQPPSTVPLIPNGRPSSANLKLTGIVTSANESLAVISAGGKPRFYSLNQYIGSDKIIAITSNYVILVNGDRRTVLQLEAAGQKGGK